MVNDVTKILANPNGKAWEFAQAVCTYADAKKGKRFELGPINITQFPNGEILPQIGVNVRAHDCYFIHDSRLDPQYWLTTLGLVNDALKRSSAGTINDVFPLTHYARQDRMTGPRTPISAKVVASVVQTHGDRVITSDLHNPAVAGFYDIPFDNLKAYLVMIEHLKKEYGDILKKAVLVAPDVGSTKRVESYQKKLGLEAAIIEKRRNPETNEVEEMRVIGNVSGKHVIMVDDMIDTAGTNIEAAETLKKEGALKIYSCATHGIFSRNAKKRIRESALERVIITDSVPRRSGGKIEVVTLTPLFGEAIYSITHGESVSALYK